MKESVFICIATYNRDELLERCVNSVLASVSMFDSEYFEFHIVVVDNSKNGTAKEKLESAYEGKAIFLHEQKAGIPYVRNTALSYALGKGANYIAFIDDDEYVKDNWAEVMTGSITSMFEVVDVVSGNVDQNGICKRKSKDAFFRDRAETDNVIMKRWVAERFKFDESLRYTGGTDTLFFRQAHQAGAIIKFNPASIVYEPVAESRDSFLWDIKRNFRYGNIGALIENKLNRKPIYLVKHFSLYVSRFIAGMAGMLFGLCFFQFGLAKKSALRMARGAGGTSRYFGVGYQEYKRSE